MYAASPSPLLLPTFAHGSNNTPTALYAGMKNGPLAEGDDHGIKDVREKLRCEHIPLSVCLSLLLTSWISCSGLVQSGCCLYADFGCQDQGREAAKHVGRL